MKKFTDEELSRLLGDHEAGLIPQCEMIYDLLWHAHNLVARASNDGKDIVIPPGIYNGRGWLQRLYRPRMSTDLFLHLLEQIGEMR